MALTSLFVPSSASVRYVALRPTDTTHYDYYEISDDSITPQQLHDERYDDDNDPCQGKYFAR